MTKLKIRTHYDSNEIDILETYTHRLQDKIHISYLPGAFGDFVISGIFLSLGQTKEVKVHKLVMCDKSDLEDLQNVKTGRTPYDRNSYKNF